MQIEGLSTGHVERAAELLHSRLRREIDAGRPWRSEYVGDVSLLASQVAERLGTTDGYAALDGDRLVGFMQAEERTQRPWPPSYWADVTSHAAVDPDVYRHLYSAAAGRWVELGRMDHFAFIPAFDADAWTFFSLGFGLEQVYGIRSLDDVEVKQHPEAQVRRASLDDFDLLRDLFDVLPRYQEGSPTFGPNPIPRAELEGGHRELLRDPSAHYWIATSEGRAAGLMILEPVPDDPPTFYPARTISLDVAAVGDDFRGRGVGGALTSAALRHAATEGFTHCITDWRSPNPTSGPTWRRWGFVPYGYRVHRTIDARLAPPPA